MNLYEFVGLCRSGHHAMLNWIIKNMVGFQTGWEYKMIRMGGSNLYYLNEANHDIDLSFQYIKDSFSDIETFFVGYEDVMYDYTIFRDDFIYRGPLSNNKFSSDGMKSVGRIVFIRDFYNNLGSRIQANQNNKLFIKITGEPHVLNTEENYINTWKNLAKAILEKKVSYLKFEDWIYNQDIRNQFLLETFNTKAMYSTEDIKGTTSSFGHSKTYNKRFDPQSISDRTKELIRKDNELHYLIGAMGYEYKEI